MKTEIPQPEQVVVDPPKLSEMKPPTRTAEAVPLNSHTNRLTHFPETPSMEDEYADDIKRQAREVRETLDFQMDDEERRTGRKKPEKPYVSHFWDTDKKDEKGKNDKKSDGLPPGTIQACVRSRRSERRPRYVM
jgi:hypothetical protein